MAEAQEMAALDVGGFHGPVVCALVGITYRQLDYWARTGLLRPSLVEAKGSGTKRVYSYQDVLELKVIKQLLDSGISLQSARRAVDCLREELGADLASANLVLTSTRSVLARSNGEVVDLLAGGQGCSTSSRSRALSTSWRPISSASKEASRSPDARVRRLPMWAFGPEPPGSDARAVHRWSAAHPSFARARVRGALRPSLRTPIRRVARHPWNSLEYEPVEFALRWDDGGSPNSGFRPDFWLADQRCFVELTTATSAWSPARTPRSAACVSCTPR